MSLTLGRCLRYYRLSSWRLVKGIEPIWIFMSSPGDDKVVAVAHAFDSLHDFTLVVFDDFDPFQAL